jgi:hypothetical protein
MSKGISPGIQIAIGDATPIALDRDAIRLARSNVLERGVNDAPAFG